MPVFVAGALLAQRVLLSSRYDVGGHAAEHLATASAPFMAAAVLAILLWATPRARHQIDVLVAAAAWFTTMVLVMLGNLRVIDDLVAAGYSHASTGSVPDVADHALADSSIWYAVVAALMLVASFRWRRHIGNGGAIGAAIATVFPAVDHPRRRGDRAGDRSLRGTQQRTHTRWLCVVSENQSSVVLSQ